MNTPCALRLLSSAVIFSCATASLAGLVQYVGDPNPSTVDAYLSEPGFQPWAINIDPPTPPAGPSGDTPASWNINTTGNAGSEYKVVIPATANDQAITQTQGFKMKALLRVNGVNDTVGAGVQFLYLDGLTIYRVNFGTDGDGDPIVRLSSDPGGPSFTLEGVGNDEYHLFELVKPRVGGATLSVDGTPVITNFAGEALNVGFTQILWGDATGGDGGNASWAYVVWQTPEPSTSLLGTLGLAALAWLGRQKRRRFDEPFAQTRT